MKLCEYFLRVIIEIGEGPVAAVDLIARHFITSAISETHVGFRR